MQIDFDGEPPEPEWPEGISVRTFVRGQDDHAVWAAHQDAFADGFEHATWPYESWQEWAFSESFDPSLWFVAEEGEEIAGVCLCKAQRGQGASWGGSTCSVSGARGAGVAWRAPCCCTRSRSSEGSAGAGPASASTA